MLLDCVIREGRCGDRGRDRRKCSDCGLGFEQASSPDSERSVHSDEHAARLEAIEPQSGVRRDRSALFRRMRATAAPQRRAPRGCHAEERCARTDGGAENGAIEELARIYEEASQTHTWLVSKLAQHNGLRQFGADFTNRAPPLELRMLLPELEVSIDQLLETLRTLGSRLQVLDLAAAGCGSIALQVRDAVSDYVAKAFEEARSTFEQQRKHLQELALASPLFSPKLYPVLGRKLAAAIGSPSLSSTAPASPWQNSQTGTLSTPPSTEPLTLPPVEMLLLDELSDGEDIPHADAKPNSRPFDSLLSVGIVNKPVPDSTQ